MLVSNPDDVLDGIYCAENVADVCDADNLGAFVEEFLILIHLEQAVVGNGYNAQPYATSGLQELPRNDVAVVLHLAEDDFVAFLHESLTEARCYEIDALRRSASKDNLRRAACIEESTHGLSGSFV